MIPHAKIDTCRFRGTGGVGMKLPYGMFKKIFLVPWERLQSTP